MSDQFIKSKAAIAWEANKPLSVEEVDVMLPKAGEVLVRIVATGVAIPMPLRCPVKTLRGFFQQSSAMKAAVLWKWWGRGLPALGLVTM